MCASSADAGAARACRSRTRRACVRARDRVRETLFNWLQPVLAGRARAGPVRRQRRAGAGSAVAGRARGDAGRTRSSDGRAACAQAVERLDASEQAHVVRADALAWLRAPMHGRFDIVFVDPPFEAALWEQVLELLPPWLADDAWLYLEAPASTRIAPRAAAGYCIARASTREVRYALYRRAGGRRCYTCARFQQRRRRDE